MRLLGLVAVGVFWAEVLAIVVFCIVQARRERRGADGGS